jgi:hypothetical protein
MDLPMRAFIALILFAVLAQSAHAETSGDGRQYFGNWLATCRTDGYCSATAQVTPPAGNAAVADFALRVGRHAQQTYWEIAFTATAAEIAPTSSVDVVVDGKAERFAQPGTVGAFGSRKDFYFLGKGAQNVMDRLAHGSALGVSFTDRKGESQHANFALSGIAQALLWIDTQQHRIGSERVAETPPYGLEPIVEGQVANQGAAPSRVPPVLLAEMSADAACSPTEPIDRIRTDDLGDGYTLFVVPCLTDANNAVERAYLGSSQSLDTVALPQLAPTGGWTASSLLFNSSFDPTTLTLTSTYRGDAPGSCGNAGKWMWLDAPFFAPKAFTLIEFRAKPTCDGAPGSFPVLYPAAR